MICFLLISIVNNINNKMFNIQPIFHLRKSWNTPFASTANMLKFSAKIAPRNINAMQFLSDLIIVPKFILSSDIRCEISNNPVGEWFHPKNPNGYYILYFHGGAFSCCNTKSHRLLLHNLANVTNSTILSIDYKRPPEYPYPIPIQDCFNAYVKLLETVNPLKIFIAGDSAGGNLAVTTMLKIIELKLPKPAGGILISPWIDLTDIGVSQSWATNKHYDYIPKTLAKLFANEYLGKENIEDKSFTLKDLSPSYSDKLNLLPPLLVEFGQCEVLHDQILNFCNKVKESGGNITFNAREDMIHVFPMYSFTKMKQCNDFFESVNDFLKMSDENNSDEK